MHPVTPNSRTHWTLLAIGVIGSVAFTTTYLVEGALRPGYDWLRQPISALSLGPGGTLQSVSFVLFGVSGCLAAPAWRATLAGGRGHLWYPRLKVLAGLALIAAGLFDQDAGQGYPVGSDQPAHPSLHATVHNLASVVSLVTIVAQLVILGQRFAREPRWRAWAPAAFTVAVLMMASLAAFGALTALHGPGGIFEKLAGSIPAALGIAVTARLVARRDARIGASAPAGASAPRPRARSVGSLG